MYYYKVVGNLVYKYEVKLDLLRLHRVKNEVKDNCSIITHKKYETTTLPESRPTIVNYKKEKVGMNNDDIYKYLVEYDEIEYSPLVFYIVELMLGHTDSIEKIEKFKEEVEDFDMIIKNIVKEQQVIINNLDKIEDFDVKMNLLVDKRKQLLEYKQKRELNKHRISANKYRKEVLRCITLNEVELIPLKTLLDANDFLKDCKDTTMHSSLEKKLVRK